VVEIGTWHGASVTQLAKARPDLSFVCIDTFAEFESYNKQKNGRPDERLLLWLKNKRPNIFLFMGNTEEWCKLGLEGAFELIIVDGDHSTSAVEKDLRWARSHLKAGGLIILHDWKLPSVKAAVKSSGARVLSTPGSWCRVSFE